MTSDLDALLGRWHEWRRGYSHERRYARQALVEDGNDLDRMEMKTLERIITAMSSEHQLALAHEARSLALGVDVFRSPRLTSMSIERQQALLAEATTLLQRKLRHEGLL